MQRLVDIAPAQIPQIWALLSQIPDPEVPVLTITDLGMVRSVKAQGGRLGHWLHANLLGLSGYGTPAGGDPRRDDRERVYPGAHCAPA